MVLEAWALIAPKNATLDVFGDGPKREVLEMQAKDLPSIQFHGPIEDPARAYEVFDIAIMPSLWEPYGLSCIEARATGRPVIVSDVDGLPEQMRNGGGMVIANELPTWLHVFSADAQNLFLSVDAKKSKQTAIEDQKCALLAWTRILGPFLPEEMPSLTDTKSLPGLT